jgi:hypothetical protein
MTRQQLTAQMLSSIKFHLKSLPVYSKGFLAYVKSGALWRDMVSLATLSYQFINQLPRWRLAFIGAALYVLLPLLPTPIWHFQLLMNPAVETEPKLKLLETFYQKHGDAVLPVLQAQLHLQQLHQYEQQLIAKNQRFSAQSRDEKWAEATEFMIAHLAQSVTENQLRILDSECRNNLCRIEIYAPKGLTPEFQALVLKYASTLKRGDLEFQDLVPASDRILLELKSDKKLKYGYWATRALEPAAKEQWQQTVRAWLHPQPIDGRPKTPAAHPDDAAKSASETPVK